MSPSNMEISWSWLLNCLRIRTEWLISWWGAVKGGVRNNHTVSGEGCCYYWSEQERGASDHCTHWPEGVGGPAREQAHWVWSSDDRLEMEIWRSLVYFMYPNNQGGDTHNRKENPIYRNNKENNILRKKHSNHVQNLYEENATTLPKGLKVDLNKWKDTLCC